MAIKNENGFWLNARGEAVHEDLVRVDERIKDELVGNLISKVLVMQKELAELKAEIKEDIESYYELLLQQYKIDAKKGGKKGNFSLENFSGTQKIQISMAETLSFDEKLSIAKLKIDEYLNDVTKDSPAEIRTLITKAFEVDKKGNIDSKKIFALRSYDIKDPRWVEAMSIIEESKRVASIKPYMRFYVRDEIEDDYEMIKLDFANV